MKALEAQFKKMNRPLFFTILLICLLNSSYVRASWISRGPYGGYINSMAMAANPDVIYAGTASGIFKTVTGGVSWTKTGFPDIRVNEVQVAPGRTCQKIDFDEVAAPCDFAETIALTDEYSELGVYFSGPGGKDGGAILNECSSFSPTGHSSPNFLAFSTLKTLMDGGIPQGPETIAFTKSVNHVRLHAAWNHMNITMDAYDTGNNLLDSDTDSAISSVKPMQVSAAGIARVVLHFSGAATLLVDDLAWYEQPEVQAPDMVYAGTDDGIYKSVDGGTTWVYKGLAGQKINTIAIDPYCSEIIYAGTGEIDLEPEGIYKSVDGGDTWQLKYTGDLDLIRKIAIDANEPSTIYAIGNGIDGSPNYNGFVRSKNGGESWTGKHVSQTGPWDDVFALAVTGAGIDPPVMYAVVSDTPGKDVFKSIDRGDTWQKLGIPNLPYSEPYVLAVLPHVADYFYVNSADSEGILYLVNLADMVYYIIGDGLPAQPERPSSMLINPQNPNTLYLGFPYHGVFKSTVWPPVWNASVQGLNNIYIEDIAVDPTTSETVFIAIKGLGSTIGYPLATSVDGGASWNELVNSPADLRTVSIDPQVPSTVYVGLNPHAGNFFNIYKSADSGQTWSDIRFLYIYPASTTLGVADIRVDPRDSGTILIAGADFGGPNNGGGIYKTLDGGDSWQRTYSFWAQTIAADPLNPEILYFGSRQCGYVFRSINTGSSWVDISPAAPPGQCWVNEVRSLAVDSYARVFAATDAGLWRWNSSGWTRLDGLPYEDITAISIDRSTVPETVYAGTATAGVFLSEDGGSSWLPFNDGLQNLTITKLELSAIPPRILYAATAYGGLWRHNFAPEPCEGDFNEDQKVDRLDLPYFCDDFGKMDCNGDCDSDGDGDQDADGKDLAAIIADYGRTDCPEPPEAEN
jgi:hypothetical protein